MVGKGDALLADTADPHSQPGRAVTAIVMLQLGRLLSSSWPQRSHFGTFRVYSTSTRVRARYPRGGGWRLMPRIEASALPRRPHAGTLRSDVRTPAWPASKWLVNDVDLVLRRLHGGISTRDPSLLPSSTSTSPLSVRRRGFLTLSHSFQRCYRRPR